MIEKYNRDYDRCIYCTWLGEPECLCAGKITKELAENFTCDMYDPDFVKAVKEGYEEGIKDVLMPYDVESIEELIENVRRNARADAIDEYRLALHFKYEDNKKISDAINELGINFANLDLEEIDTIAELLKQEHFDKADKMITEPKYVSVEDCHKHCKNDGYLCNECHKIFNDCFMSNNPYQE